ncbi:MAG: phosphoribosylanthranilate isomerase [Promethearchaeota archaeon]
MEYVKICGMKKLEIIYDCIAFGATAVGLVYNIPSSPRNLNEKEINALVKGIKNKITTVVVIKPKNNKDILETINKIDADLYQIHYTHDFDELLPLPKEIKKKIIIALRVNEKNKTSVINKINETSDQFFAFLLDGSEGHGVIYDHDLTHEIMKKVNPSKIIIAGGISLDNIENIMRTLHPFGIDVSSSLESERGVKDPRKIKIFLSKLNEIKIKLHRGEYI